MYWFPNAFSPVLKSRLLFAHLLRCCIGVGLSNSSISYETCCNMMLAVGSLSCILQLYSSNSVSIWGQQVIDSRKKATEVHSFWKFTNEMKWSYQVTPRHSLVWLFFYWDSRAKTPLLQVIARGEGATRDQLMSASSFFKNSLFNTFFFMHTVIEPLLCFLLFVWVAWKPWHQSSWRRLF